MQCALNKKFIFFRQFTGIQKDQNHGPPQSHPNHQRTMSAPMPIGGQFNPPFRQQDVMPNQMLMQQQQNLIVQQQHQQNLQRQLSLDNPYQQNEFQDQLNYHQDQRRHHSHDRENRSSRNNYHQDQQQNYGRFIFF